MKRKKIVLAFSIVPAFIIVKILSNYPVFVETYYSNGLYVFLSKIERFLLGWIPFSFGDILYFFIIVFTLYWLFKNRKRIFKDTKNWLADVFAFVAMLYIVFHLLWGLNYYRLPLHQTLQLEATYTTEELVAVTKQLIQESQSLLIAITNTDSIAVTIPYSKQEIIDKVPEAYNALPKEYKVLTYTPISIKKSLWSQLLTYMGFSGYLNPFTNEAQTNALLPLFKQPTTTAHEVAHQLGFAAENEANFIGFLATRYSKDTYFKYASSTFALRHCLYELYLRDEEIYKQLRESIPKGVLKNYEEVRVFWNTYENPLEPLFKFTYTNYLKANNQKGGMETYNYVVALVVNYLKK